MTDAELRALLRDCAALWDVPAHVEAGDADGVVLTTTAGLRFAVARAEPARRPVRWLLHTPSRAAAGRGPRAAASIVALLSALRNELGGAKGARLRVG